MPSSNDSRLLEPIKFGGPAFERDRLIKDKNDANKSDEARWSDTMREQDAAMSDQESEFFAELPERAHT